MIAIMRWDGRARERTLPPGEVLFRAGDPVQALYRVERGAIRLVRPLPHGAQLVNQRATAGAILAEASLFAAAYHCDAVAENFTRLRGVPVVNPGMARAFTRHLALEVERARARAEAKSLRTAKERLEAWI